MSFRFIGGNCTLFGSSAVIPRDPLVEFVTPLLAVNPPDTYFALPETTSTLSGSPPGYGAKYPSISKNTSAGFETKILMALDGPAGTNAALARISPSTAFSVDTTGCAVPEGQVLSQPKAPAVGTAVMFNEYAAAVVGMPHGLDGSGNDRVPLAGNAGGP